MLRFLIVLALANLALPSAFARVGEFGRDAEDDLVEDETFWSRTLQMSVSMPEPSTPDIVETAVSAGVFNTLVTALSAAGLVEALSAPNGPFTVFAPTDDAFAALPEGLVGCLVEDTETLSTILLYHVVSGAVLSTDLSDGLVVETLSGGTVTVDLSDGVKINESTVIAADVLATNGVIHVIDAVLVPAGVDVGAYLEACTSGSSSEPTDPEPPVDPMEPDEPVDLELFDIPSTAIAAGGFDTLVAALTTADLVGALSESGPFTVFAPTDDAFAELPDGLVGCLLEDTAVLTSILLYHVVGGAAVFSTDLVDGQVVETLNGGTATVDLSDGVKINSSTVIVVDIAASNGVIHVIDSVLVPPDVDVANFLELCLGEPELLDIPSTAIATGGLDILVHAISSNDLTETLSEPNGPFTVFAPVDEFFQIVPPFILECLIDARNMDTLTPVLLYHVVPGVLLSTDLSDGDSLTTVNGANVEIAILDGDLIINNTTKIVTADIEASNGVVHTIDSLLLPPGIDINELAPAILANCEAQDEP